MVGNDDFGDIYEQPRNLVDLQLSQKILNNRCEVRLTVGDLLNQPFATYENRDDNRTFNSTTDKYFSTYKPGTTFTVGFNYNFDLQK